MLMTRYRTAHTRRSMLCAAGLSLCGLAMGSPLSRFHTPDGDPAGGGTGGSGGGTGGGAASPSVEDLQRQLTDLNTKFSATQTERDDLAKKVKDREDKDKTEEQRTKDNLADAERKAADAEAKEKATTLRLSIEREARKAGIVDEEAAYKLIDTGSVVYDKDGKPTNIVALLEQLVKDKPYLKAAGTAGNNNSRPAGGASSGATGGAGNTSRTRNQGDSDEDVTPGLGRLKAAYAAN